MQVNNILRRILFLLSGLIIIQALNAQKVPSTPLSIPVYHPMVINPAFVGSKDFTNISMTTKVLKNPNNQIINIHRRMKGSENFFSGIGLGAYIFQEQLTNSWNTGLAVAGAYHFALDEASIHNLSIGTSLKGFLNVPKNSGESGSDSASSSFNPNLDFGIYYYGPTAFAGLSVTSILDTKLTNGLTIESAAYIPREYHLYGGYKFLVNKSNSIVIEPSLLLTLNDSTLSEPQKHLVPYLKFYLQNFYVGTRLRSLDIFALFFQYQFPRFYTGVFLEFPRVGFLNDDNIIFEFSVGVNIGRQGQKFLQYRHW